MKNILLITPPFTQLNTPYPATAYLKGFLNTKKISSYQMDLGIEVILELFTKESLEHLFNFAAKNNKIESDNCRRIYALKDKYLTPLENIIKFLQGKNQNIARLICTDTFLPRASRFDQLEDLDWTFGTMGLQDKAKHLATLYIEDISDFIVECIDENFGFSRYAEKLGNSANSFDELYTSLQNDNSFIDTITLKKLDETIKREHPKMICISVPFPGNLYSAFKCAQFIKITYPNIVISMGGGFPNTELRTLTDIRVFEYFDYITLDDGELPIELLYKNINNNTLESHSIELKRTFHKVDNKVVYNDKSSLVDYKLAETGTPDYSDLLLDQYISVIEIANPMHSLWSDGRWNKLTMGHGCYWGKCTFCDGSLDYIKRFEPVTATIIVDRMVEIIDQTGENGFHFVDEAAPPSLMKAIAIEIIRREITVTWWTNVRFEKQFTKDLCRLLSAAGCIAVSGGLEVASDRLLKLINKGVTVEQVAKVTRNFTESGIMVHSYLMFGFPTQTSQETVDCLEMVRQLFELGIVHSGFWHQFSLTAHSPIGLEPNKYGVTPQYKKITFANNDIEFKDKTGINHSKFSFGLKKALFNYMRGVGFDIPLNEWFDFKTPKTRVEAFFIEECLDEENSAFTKSNSKIIWLGGEPKVTKFTKVKKGKTKEFLTITFDNKTDKTEVSMKKENADWFIKILKRLSVKSSETLTYSDIKADYEIDRDSFDLFWQTKPIQTLRENGLLVV